MKRLASVLILLFTVFSFPALSAAPEPATATEPVPTDKAIEEATKLVREVHKADYAKKKPAELVEFARKLLKEGDETTDNPAAKFVLYRESRDLAARGGDLPLALDAVAAAAKVFAIKSPDFVYAALEAAEKARIVPDRMVVETALENVNGAIRADDYTLAERLLKLASAAASRAAGLGPVVSARVKDVAAIRKGFEATEADRKAVESGKADPAAITRVGRFICLLKGDWDAGLPLLAKGDDEKLKVTAELELARPTKGEDKATIADWWFELASGLEPAERPETRLHAYQWYEEASSELTGLSKTRVEKRLSEIEKIEPRSMGTGWTVIFRSADPSIWNSAVSRGPDNLAVPLGKASSRIKYLKMTEMSKKQYVIIEMTKDRLGKQSEKDGYGWNGKGAFEWAANTLGIFNLAWDPSPLGAIVVYGPQGHPYNGWGFGYRYFGNDRQGFAWNRDAIEKTVFEIAVKTSYLTAEESKHLLKRTKK